MSAEDKLLFLEEMGLHESGLDRLIKKSYALLGLISYLTAGKQEVRAWTITRGTKAPQAAGKIHSDFEKGFTAPRSSRTTTSSPAARWPPPRRRASSARRARNTSCRTATSSSSASTSDEAGAGPVRRARARHAALFVPAAARGARRLPARGAERFRLRRDRTARRRAASESASPADGAPSRAEAVPLESSAASEAGPPRPNPANRKMPPRFPKPPRPPPGNAAWPPAPSGRATPLGRRRSRSS